MTMLDYLVDVKLSVSDEFIANSRLSQQLYSLLTPGSPNLLHHENFHSPHHMRSHHRLRHGRSMRTRTWFQSARIHTHIQGGLKLYCSIQWDGSMLMQRRRRR